MTHYTTPDGKTVELHQELIAGDPRRRYVRHPDLGVIQIEVEKLTKVEPPEPRYGDLVRVRCSATGRYLMDGLALVVSAMDNSLFLDDVDLSKEAATNPVVPHDRALDGAIAVMTSGKYDRIPGRRPV